MSGLRSCAPRPLILDSAVGVRAPCSAGTPRPKLASDERGLSTVEYVILLVLIAALAVATWNAFGKEIRAKLGASGGQIQQNLEVDYSSSSPGSGANSPATGSPPASNPAPGNSPPATNSPAAGEGRSGPRTKG